MGDETYRKVDLQEHGLLSTALKYTSNIKEAIEKLGQIFNLVVTLDQFQNLISSSTVYSGDVL